MVEVEEFNISDVIEENSSSINSNSIEEGGGSINQKQKAKDVNDNDDKDEKYRKQMSASFLWRSWFLIILCFLGFLPAILVFISEKTWYLITWYAFPPGGTLAEDIPNKNTLSAHAIFGVLWVGVVLFQAWAGATQGVNRRRMHRFLGTISPIIVFLPFVGTASYMQFVTMHFPISPDSMPAFIVPYYTVFFMILGMTFAYHAAKFKRDYAMHKDCILFTITYSVIAGLVRAFLYLAQSFFRVDCSIVTTGYGPELTLQASTAISTVMCMLILGQAWWSLGRLSPKHKLNRWGMGSLLFLVIYSSVDSLRLGIQYGYSCPS